MGQKRKILWAVFVALGSVSLARLGVDMEKFTVPAWIVSAAWAIFLTVVYYEFKPVVLGWFGRKRTPKDYEVWEEDRGRGDLAASLITTAQGFVDAEEIFNHCRHDKQPRKLAMAKDAMANRLIKEGRTDETMRFLENEDLGLHYQLTVNTPPKEGATERGSRFFRQFFSRR